MFGIKDLFTTVNLLGGIVAICLCIDGQPYWAGVSVMLGYLLGDVFDGYVARKLGTANQFGAEYDTIADHTSHVIAPAAIVYTVYKDVGLVPAPWNLVLAGVLAASMIISVSIRHARNIVAPVEYKGVWAGLPRSVVGFLAIGYCNAALAPQLPGGWWLGVVLMPAMAIGTLTYVPYPNHRLARAHRWYVMMSVYGFFVVTIGIAAIWPRYLFDMLAFFMAGYSLTAWLSLTRAERVEFRRIVEASTRASAVDGGKGKGKRASARASLEDDAAKGHA